MTEEESRDIFDDLADLRRSAREVFAPAARVLSCLAQRLTLELDAFAAGVREGYARAAGDRARRDTARFLRDHRGDKQ